MFCEKCGKENKEGSAFCESCGAPFAANSAGSDRIETKSWRIEKQGTGKLVRGICFLLIAVFALISAILIFGFETGGGMSWKNYGGDAYTGIQNAAAQTAYNVFHNNVILKDSFGLFMLAFCFTLGTIGISDIVTCDKKTKIVSE